MGLPQGTPVSPSPSPPTPGAEHPAAVPLAGLAPLLAEPFCLEFSCKSWNQSRNRSPRSARS